MVDGPRSRESGGFVRTTELLALDQLRTKAGGKCWSLGLSQLAAHNSQLLLSFFLSSVPGHLEECAEILNF